MSDEALRPENALVAQAVEQVRSQEDLRQMQRPFHLQDLMTTQLGLASLTAVLSALTLYVTKPMFVQSEAVREHVYGKVSGWRVLIVSVMVFLIVLLLPRLMYAERAAASRTVL